MLDRRRTESPARGILKDRLDIELRGRLDLKEMKGYCLHSDNLSLDLDGEDHGQSWAVSRSHFDALMLDEARKAGAEVFDYRVTGLEFSDENVRVYGEAAIVIGRWQARGINAGQTFDYTARYMSVWVWRDERWQLVSDQSTDIS